MKNFIIPLFLLLFSANTFSQSEEDYTKTIDFISESINSGKASLIYQKFNTNLKNEQKEEAIVKELEGLRKEQGLVSGYELLTDESGVKNYLIEFENSSMLMLLHLSPEKEILTFKIKEY